jgi:hypothetical protein
MGNSSLSQNIVIGVSSKFRISPKRNLRDFEAGQNFFGFHTSLFLNGDEDRVDSISQRRPSQ